MAHIRTFLDCPSYDKSICTAKTSVKRPPKVAAKSTRHSFCKPADDHEVTPTHGTPTAIEECPLYSPSLTTQATIPTLYTNADTMLLFMFQNRTGTGIHGCKKTKKQYRNG
jgi:hypothetical protein